MRKHIAVPAVSPRDTTITSLILEETQVPPCSITQAPCSGAAPAQPTPQTWGWPGLAVPLQHPQPSVCLLPLGHPSTQQGLRDRLLGMSHRCHVRLLVMKPKQIRKVHNLSSQDKTSHLQPGFPASDVCLPLYPASSSR